ncbi:MAG: hypothetical protein Q9210_000845 [Variospora velana]
METGPRNWEARLKELCISTPRTPPDSPGSFNHLARVSNLGTSDATLATYEDAMEDIKRRNDEMMRGFILEGIGNKNNDARPDPAITYTLDAVLHGRTAFHREPIVDNLHRSVNRFRLQNALYSPAPPRKSPPDITVEDSYGLESPEARTRAFVDQLYVALADIAGLAPSPQAQDPEISPPKVFPPPHASTPAPDPTKPRVMVRGSPDMDLAEVFPVPSPGTPISDPVKRQEATGGSPGRPRRAIRRVMGLADINRTSVEGSVGERLSPSLGHRDCACTNLARYRSRRI